MTNEDAIKTLLEGFPDTDFRMNPKERLEAYNKYQIALNMAIKTLKERPQGEWKYNQYDGNANIGNWHCSECRHIVYGGYSQKPYYNFCPACGADMGGEE